MLRKTLSTLASHRISTRFPQREHSGRRTGEQNLSSCSFTARNGMAFRFRSKYLFGACRSGRRSNLKRSLGGSAFRETLQEPCSRMRTPRRGVNWRLSVFDVGATDTIQTNSDTQRIVLGFKVYSRTPEIVQGGIEKVTFLKKNGERRTLGASQLRYAQRRPA